MRSWLRRLWLRFELWNQGYCLKHKIRYDWHSDSDGERWRECVRCKAEAKTESKRLRKEQQEYIDNIIAELREWELKHITKK